MLLKKKVVKIILIVIISGLASGLSQRIWYGK